MSEDKRQAKRIDTKLEVKYGDITSFISDYAMNISRGGMFISTKNPLKANTVISVEFVIPDIKVPIQVKGRVSWINDPQEIKGTNLIPGMGIEFHALSPDDQKKLHNFIDKISLRQAS
jgi:type IV pilus assembly protein PilZ